MFEGFKKFVMRGNILDMAVGVMIGGAFSKIVSSLVADIITPIISVLTNKVDLTNLYITIGTNQKFDSLAQAKEAGVTTLSYGVFLQNVIDFLIIAVVIYLFITQVERIKKIISQKVKDEQEEVVEDVKDKECPYCFSRIDIRASRCPHCTAVIEVNGEKEEKEEAVQEEA